MKTWLALLAVPAAVCSALHAQVVPAGTGAASNFSYVLRYAQTAHFGESLSNWQTATPSGEVDFSNGHHRTPFSLIYAGGYSWTLTGPNQYSTGFFQRLSLHQVLSGEKWKASLGNDVSYRPEAPFTGFSGIPGTGEPIGVPSPPPSQSILALGTHALNNLATGELTRNLNPENSVSVGVNYDLLFFPDSNGLDTNHFSAHSDLTRRISRRSSVFGEYIFNRFSYPDVSLGTNANVVMAGCEHAFSRRLQINFAAGPGWVTSSNSKVIPDSTIVNANAGLDYQMRTGSVFVRYDRSTSGGSGYLLGQLSDVVDVGYSREFASTFTAEVIGGYRRIQPLDKSEIIHSEMGGVQGSWRFGAGHLSAFASYTVFAQASDGPLPPNVVSRPLQIASFGIAYMMRARRHF
jgi:hypothetical protein